MTRRHRAMRASLMGLLALVTLLAAGCAPPSNAGDHSLTDVQQAGQLVIGTEGTYVPFTYHDDGGAGSLTGYDVEVSRAVAAKLGVKADFEESQFDAIFAGLTAKRLDVIANQITVTDERKGKYDFSEPYTVSQGVVLVKDGETSIHSVADLKGKTTAGSLTSNYYQIAKDAGADVKGVDGWAQAVALLQEGRVDAIVNDKLTFLDFLKSNPHPGIHAVANTPGKSTIGFVARKGSDALITAINRALEELQQDGTLARISIKYFGQDVSK